MLSLPRKQWRFQIRQRPLRLLLNSRILVIDVIELTPPSPQDVIPESPPLSLDEQRAANMARNVSVARALGLRPRPESPVKQPAHRVRASWKCTPKCGQSFTKSEHLVNHLREVHQKGNNVFDLAPIGFGACPYCRGIFCALRGWRNHVASCKAPRRPLTDIFPVQLPQSCLVWYEKDNRWYEGQVFSASSSSIPSWDVMYEDARVEIERCDWVHLEFPRPPPEPSRSLSVLEECARSDIPTPRTHQPPRDDGDHKHSDTPRGLEERKLTFAFPLPVVPVAAQGEVSERALTSVQGPTVSSALIAKRSSVNVVAASPSVVASSAAVEVKVGAAPKKKGLGRAEVVEVKSAAVLKEKGVSLAAKAVVKDAAALKGKRLATVVEVKEKGVAKAVEVKDAALLKEKGAARVAKPVEAKSSVAPASRWKDKGSNKATKPVQSLPLVTSRVVRNLQCDEKVDLDLTQADDRQPIRNDPLQPGPRPRGGHPTMIDLEFKVCVPSEGSTEFLVPDWFNEHSFVKADFVADKPAVSDLMCRIHQRSSLLRTLPALELWSPHMRSRWESAVDEFAPYMQKAIQLPPKSVGFLKMLIRLQELPTLALATHMQEAKRESEGRSNLTGKLKTVESLVLQDRVNAATKVLFSHGIAPPTDAVFQRLQKLHPALKQAIPELRTNREQFFMDQRDVKEILFTKCTSSWQSGDPFGWNTALLHLIRVGPQSEEHLPFFDSYCALISRLLVADVSDLASYVLSGGSIFGLNKESEEARQAREQKGDSPKERPVNQGSLLLKLVFDLALHSPDAIGALADCAPIQMGVGAKRGMEVIAHLCHILYDQGFAILEMDASNGFQEITRASMHRSILKRCPSLLKLFQKYYTKESACFFNVDEEVKVISSCEGARIGCKLGSFVFALTLQDLYEQVQKMLLTQRDGSCIKAATDDVIMFIKADPLKKKSLEIAVKRLCATLREGGKRLGVSFDNDKAQCLLPQGWCQADVNLPGIKIYSDKAPSLAEQGIEVVGVPVGSQAYCSRTINKKIDEMLSNCESLTQLHPQSATKLLRESVCAAPAYIAQTCPPSLTSSVLRRFDDRVWNIWLKILGCDTGELKCCDSVMQAARKRAFLPCRLDGAGLRSWERTSEFAWFCSMAACIGLQDPDLDHARHFLAFESEFAYDRAMDSLGGPSYLAKSAVELIPVGENDALKGDFYLEWARVNKKHKIQKLFQAISDERHRKSLLDLETTVCNKSTRIVLSSLQNSPEGTCLLTKLFTTPLSHRDSRLTKTTFVIAARQFLCLPPLKTEGDIHERRCGCEYQLCGNPACGRGSEALLDSHGNHGLTCHPGVKAQKATLMERALERLFRKSGGVPVRQPHTYDLFGGFFTKDDLSRLFPGGMDSTTSERNKQLAMRLLDIMRDYPRGAERTALLGALRDLDFPPLVRPEGEERADMIRYDLRLPSTEPVDCPKELWIDHAIVQETAMTYAQDVLDYLHEGKNPSGSVAFVKTKGSKLRRYVGMNSVVERLVIEKKLNFRPRFSFPVISALGYFNEDMVKLVHFFGARFASHTKTLPQTQDGLTLEQKKGKFKRELYSSLCFALIRGNCLSVYNQGRVGVVTPI